MLVNKIPYRGVFIEVYNFGKENYYYPSFNHNYEVKIDGYRKLCSYIRTVKYLDNLIFKL